MDLTFDTQAINEMGVNNGVDKIKEHCVEIRREVQLATEETIQLINNYNEELIKRIDDYEKEYSDLFELDSSVKQEFKQTINDLEAFHTEWCLYLKQWTFCNNIHSGKINWNQCKATDRLWPQLFSL